MQNRVTVTIDGQDYTLIAGEDAAYMEKVARRVDEKIAEIKAGGRVSSIHAAILAALNLADEYYKEQAAAENLRAQSKQYLEEATSLKMQLSEAKREIFKLQNQNKKG